MSLASALTSTGFTDLLPAIHASFPTLLLRPRLLSILSVSSTVQPVHRASLSTVFPPYLAFRSPSRYEHLPTSLPSLQTNNFECLLGMPLPAIPLQYPSISSACSAGLQRGYHASHLFLVLLQPYLAPTLTEGELPSVCALLRQYYLSVSNSAFSTLQPRILRDTGVLYRTGFFTNQRPLPHSASSGA